MQRVAVLWPCPSQKMGLVQAAPGFSHIPRRRRLPRSGCVDQRAECRTLGNRVMQIPVYSAARRRPPKLVLMDTLPATSPYSGTALASAAIGAARQRTLRRHHRKRMQRHLIDNCCEESSPSMAFATSAESTAGDCKPEKNRVAYPPQRHVTTRSCPTTNHL